MFVKTVSSRDAETEPTGMYSRCVLVNMSISCVKLSHMALGVVEMGTGI